MTDLEHLFAVQEIDSATDRLRHRRAHLTERVTLQGLERELAQLGTTIDVAERRTAELSVVQSRLETEIAACEAKRAELRRRIATGSVPRELQAWTAEEESVAHRQGQLEDELLDVLEELETLEATLASLGTERDRLDGEAAVARVAATEVEVAIDAELAELAAARPGAVALVPEALLRRYDTMRPKMGGVAVARLVAGRCQGCNLQLATMAVERIRHEPPDTLVECEECGRLLLR